MYSQFDPGCCCGEWCGVWQNEPSGSWKTYAQVDIQGVTGVNPTPPPLTPWRWYHVDYRETWHDGHTWIRTVLRPEQWPPINGLPANGVGWCRGQPNASFAGQTPLPEIQVDGNPNYLQQWKDATDAWLAAYVNYYWSEYPKPDIDQLNTTVTVDGSCILWFSAWYVCPEVNQWQNPWYSSLLVDWIQWKVEFYGGRFASEPGKRTRIFTLYGGAGNTLPCGEAITQCRYLWKVLSEVEEETDDKFEFDTPYEFANFRRAGDWHDVGEPPVDFSGATVTVTIQRPDDE